jgi:outer membrane receptor for ferrienterochelin and colicin
MTLRLPPARVLALLFTLSLSISTVGAQALPTGRIVGRVIDANTGQGITDAGVQVVGTTLGVQSGVDGRFSLSNVPAGTVTLTVRRLGFTPKTVTGLQLNAGQTLEQNVSLATAAARIAAQVVTASSERGTVNEALDQQRTAVGVVNSVTAEQISRSPDGDAAQAVQRVSGVTVQDNKSIAVRGLGDRYTTVALNGARVPSPEPEKRIVPLDLFPSGLLQSVTTSKTFTPDESGDFAGALVNIQTREYPAERSLVVQFTGGYAAGSSGARLIAPRNVGGEGFAMANSKRNLPALFNQVSSSLLNVNRQDQNLLISQFRDAWTPTTTTAAPNSSASASLGGSDAIFGHRIGYLMSGSYAYSTDLKDKQVRALADRGDHPGETRTIDQFTGQTAGQSILWGGLGTLSTMIGDGSRLSFNGMYNRTADNEARVERGHFENEGVDAKITRMQYVERAVNSAQLSGEHEYGSNKLTWSATRSGVRRDQPDRSEFVQVITHPGGASTEQLQWLNTGNQGAVRTFSTLQESNSEFKGDYQLGFSAFGREHDIKIGGFARQTSRDADTRAFSISAPGAGPNVVLLDPEQIFDGRFTNPADSVLLLAPLSQGGSYDASDHLAAGYVMTEIGLSSRARLIGGARLENDRLTLNALSTLGNPIHVTKNWQDILPSLALNYQLTDQQQLRLSGSRTLARPEYRELAPILSREVLNGDDVLGNEDLQRTRITNADVRWEWYPSSGEVLSIGLFTKQFDAPIERVYQATSGARTVFYMNAKSATNYGAEIEARKNLSFLTPAFDRLQAFTNVTVMQSQIHLGEETRSSATNTTRRMFGQAPYVVNAGLTYLASGNSTSATILFNRVGPRIDAAGDRPLPDVIIGARSALDLSVRLPVAGAFSARIDAKNLLDAPYRTTQGTVIREEYRIGRTVQAGVTWRP